MVLLDRSGTVATTFSQDSSGGITTTNALAVFMRASSELFRECVIPCAPAQGTETCALRRLYWACWQLPADQRARIASALTAAGFALPSSEPLRLALGGEGEKMDEEEPAAAAVPLPVAAVLVAEAGPPSPRRSKRRRVRAF